MAGNNISTSGGLTLKICLFDKGSEFAIVNDGTTKFGKNRTIQKSRYRTNTKTCYKNSKTSLSTSAQRTQYRYENSKYLVKIVLPTLDKNKHNISSQSFLTEAKTQDIEPDEKSIIWHSESLSIVTS